MWKMATQGKMCLLLQQVSAALEKYCVKDLFGRTILHVAVEKNDYALTELILRSGFNSNPKEHCGATPLTLAVLGKCVRLCQILVDAGAKVHGPLFTTIPSPLDMSLKLNCQEIIDIFKQSDNESDEEDIIFGII